MLLAPIASLRLTVALFVLAILLIFFGTLAQVEKDIWEVMGLYFRTPIAWVPLHIFFPKTFFPTMEPINPDRGFYFPGGFLIGGMMAANLLAAHGIRFKIQASGQRLLAGGHRAEHRRAARLAGRDGRLGQGSRRGRLK